MNCKVLLLIVGMVFLLPKVHFAQAPNLGVSASFVLFTTSGAVTNTGTSILIGDIGTNSGSSTGFGNVNGVIHDVDGVSAQCEANLLTAYNHLDTITPTDTLSTILGSGQVLNAGVYYIFGNTSHDAILTLDAQSDTAATFIFQIDGAFSSSLNAKILLINGAMACKVFWKVEGVVSLSAGTSMRGTIVANNSAINLNSVDTLEGRALSINGGITSDGVFAYTPIGCGSPILTGPLAPSLGATACYALFSSDGYVTNTNVTYVTGDIGTNAGTTTGFDPLLVNGAIHPSPDGSTAQSASDLTNLYTNLSSLPIDIELLYPILFGNGLILTPHTYLLNAATTLSDTLFLDAMGDTSAVFVIKIFGAFNTGTLNTAVVLRNGAIAENLFWVVNGAVDINNNSDFKGTIISNNGAINLNTGSTIIGRALTTNGAVSTSEITITMSPGCIPPLPPIITTQPVDTMVCEGDSASFSVLASGDSLSYQWRKGSVDLIDTGNISGTTTPTLVIDSVTFNDTASDYNVIVSGIIAPNDTSDYVVLAMSRPPVIIVQPTSQTVCFGGTATLSVVAIADSTNKKGSKETFIIKDTVINPAGKTKVDPGNTINGSDTTKESGEKKSQSVLPIGLPSEKKPIPSK